MGSEHSHANVKRSIAASVWGEARRDYERKARLAARLGRQQLAAAYARAAQRAAIRAEGREP